MAAVSFRHGRVPGWSKPKTRRNNEGRFPEDCYKGTFIFEVLSASPGDRSSAAYLKCSAEIEVSVPPYLPSSLTLEAGMVSRLARLSLACLRRVTTPCSISLANLRRTVVRELIFSRKSCFSVSGCSCSSAYPISITISKSTTDFRKGKCCLSNSLSFLSPVNNFMVYIVFHYWWRWYSVAQSWLWQAQLGSFLAHIKMSAAF